MRIVLALLLFATTALAGDIFSSRQNLSGGETIYDGRGGIVLEGRPNLRGGKDYRDLDGSVRATTRPALEGEQIEIDGGEGGED